jgi:AcrR family transcriptional regulator
MGKARKTSTRERLLAAAKDLFATRGYETATLVSIATAAGTSQSQLMKYFGDKLGVFAALVEESWERLHVAIRLAIDHLSSPAEQLTLALNMVATAVEKDHALGTLLLLDGGCLRNSRQKPWASNGYRRFGDLMDEILGRIALPDGTSRVVLRTVLIGMLEQFIRSRLLDETDRTDEEYSDAHWRAMVSLVINSCSRGSDADKTPSERPALLPAQTARKEAATTPEYLLGTGDAPKARSR